MISPLTRFAAVLVATAACAAAALTTSAVPADAATPAPRPAHSFGAAIESMTPYVPQDSCDPHVWPGTAKLARLLATTYRSYGGSTWMSAYACGTDGGTSEHYEGRAIDWMVNVHDKAQHTAALAAIRWLLATDSHGNRFAMARRLGVMYMIYDNRIWGTWDGRWDPYLNCAKLTSRSDDNMCHRTHVHISLSWNGAMGRTSFWTGKVSPTDYGPCRVAGLNWAYLYTRPNLRGCPRVQGASAGRGATATKRTLVTYSGAAVRRGWRGPAVSAVQHALHVSATGYYGASTVSAVRSFQRRHHCDVTGAMNSPTWLALLRATR